MTLEAKDPAEVGPNASSDSRVLGLDVLRALAVLSVMAGHWSNNILYWFGIQASYGVTWIGSFGVQLFFVLSGFLIGRILIDQASRDPSLRNFGVFIVRRWMRTLPLYFVVLILLLVLVPPPDFAGYALQYATMTQNLIKPMPPGFWFAVSWSIVVEEWFYLLFGGLTFLSFRLARGAAWAIWPPTVLFLAAPLWLRLAVPGFTDPDGGMWTIVLFRLDQIAYGVAMAALWTRRSSLFRRPILCLAAGLLIIAMFWPGSQILPPDLYAMTVYSFIMVGCALLLPAALAFKHAPAWFDRTARTVSAQSYALYLIHYTILYELVQNKLWFPQLAPTWLCVVLAVGGPFVLAEISFRYFESPILKLRPKHGRWAHFAAQVREA